MTAYKEILRTDEMSKVAVIESLLTAESIRYVVADRKFSAVAPLPCRIVIDADDYDRAEEILIDAGFECDIYPHKMERSSS